MCSPSLRSSLLISVWSLLVSGPHICSRARPGPVWLQLWFCLAPGRWLLYLWKCVEYESPPGLPHVAPILQKRKTAASCVWYPRAHRESRQGWAWPGPWTAQQSPAASACAGMVPEMRRGLYRGWREPAWHPRGVSGGAEWEEGRAGVLKSEDGPCSPNFNRYLLDRSQNLLGLSLLHL